MVNYRRNRVPGGTYFFTVALRERASSLLVERIALLREAFRSVRHHRPFPMDAIVVLPDPLPAIWTLPAGEDDFPGRWRAVKSTFTRALVKTGLGISRDASGEYRSWQQGYWEHTIEH